MDPITIAWTIVQMVGIVASALLAIAEIIASARKAVAAIAF